MKGGDAGGKNGRKNSKPRQTFTLVKGGASSFGVSFSGPTSPEEAVAKPGVFVSNIKPDTPAGQNKELLSVAGLQPIVSSSDLAANAACVAASQLRVISVNGTNVRKAVKQVGVS